MECKSEAHPIQKVPSGKQNVSEAGFEFCTPIQAETLPLALAGQDVAGQAQTGTGKTAAFLLAAFNYLLTHLPEDRRPTQPRAIMLAPTRELAVQIHKDAVGLGAHTGFRLGLVFGGTGYDTQRRMLEEGVDVLIGTPGRIIDYLKQHVFDLEAVQVMVLDEADRMFDLGFIKDIRFLLRRMPPPDQRLNMLFSATLSYRVTELAYEHMNNPQFVRIEPDKRTVDKVTQVLYHVAMEEKISLLVHLLRHMDPARSLVFINTKDMGERLAVWLKKNGFNAAVLSGDVPQTQRLRILRDFTEGKLPILVATDVAARGLHIPDVSHVFNFDLPQNAEDYVHRIGRTARAGAAGDAVSFACEKYVFSLPEIETYLGHKITTAPVLPEMLPPLEVPSAAELPRRVRRDDHRGVRPRGDRPDSRRPGRPSHAARPERAPRQESRPTQPVVAPPPPIATAPIVSAPIRKPVSQPVSAPKPTTKPLLRRAGRDTPIIG
ncbi:MAG: DEAD/DEAH box helicase [Gammaproteobacteria bacterium]|nr:DEAD/DEAH box helicase [Gammaproteobacteria bacterium]